jgi:farnesyl diphosphate synthase
VAEDFGVEDIWRYDVAAALEAVHVYSLVHDDLPCMDNDILRRGKPTCHVVYGEATALLVGDSLQTLGFEWLSNTGLNAPVKSVLFRLLAHAIGINGMAGGQQLDLIFENKADVTLLQLESIHRMKTGALIEASILMGAAMSPLAQNEKDNDALRSFGRALGLAFQVMDDILDVISDTSLLGKTAGKDIAQNKATYVKLLGLEKAKFYFHDLNQEACEALQQCSRPLPRLLALQRWLLDRTF